METKRKNDDMTIIEQQQDEQSVQDTQMSSVSPPYDTSVTETITIKDVSNASTQNINPLIANDLKNILDQSTLQPKLCDNPILVNVEELQKAITEVTRDKVNPQEPPTSILAFDTNIIRYIY